MKTAIIIPTLNEEKAIAEVVRGFSRQGFDVYVIDGHSKDRTIEVAKSSGAKILVQRGRGKGDTVKDADCLIFMVDHDGFKDFDLSSIKNHVAKHCAIVDCRGLFKSEDVRKLGFKYAGVGRV